MANTHRIVKDLEWVAMTTHAAGIVPRAIFPHLQEGLTFERRIKKELHRHAAFGNLTHLLHTPQIDYVDAQGHGVCFPDFIFLRNNHVVVVEIKLSWIPTALPKLKELYIPLIERLFNKAAVPLVITKRLVAAAPASAFSIREALALPSALLSWPQSGHVIW